MLESKIQRDDYYDCPVCIVSCNETHRKEWFKTYDECEKIAEKQLGKKVTWVRSKKISTGGFEHHFILKITLS